MAAQPPHFFVAFLVVSLLVFYLWRARRGPPRTRALLLVAVALLCLKVGLDASYRPYQTLAGVLKNFRVIVKHGVVAEQFEAEGVSFGYLDIYTPTRFRKSATNGGPMREGIPVRISYREGCIVKLEVATEAQNQ